MGHTTLFWLVSILYHSGTTLSQTANDSSSLEENGELSEAEVVKSLLDPSYDRRIRPANIDENGNNQPVEVDVNIYVRSMSNIDFVNMEYSAQLTFRQSWKDPRLAYNHRGTSLPHYVTITQQNLIWIPDTFFVNEKSAHRHVIDTPNMLFRIYSDGTVLYSERLSLVQSCPMYLQKYPMDKQSCNLDFASYAYTDEDIVYKWKDVSPIQFHPLLNSSLPCFTLDTVEPGSCTSMTNTGTYSCLRTVFHLHRQFSYYLVQVYIPSTLLVIVSWVSFWLDRNAVPARVTLGVTTLLTMTTQVASINSGLPPVSYVKAIDIWTGTCLFFIFSAVLEFAMVSLAVSSIQAKKDRLKNCQQHNSLAAKVDQKTTEEGEDESLLLQFCAGRKLSMWQKWTYGADSGNMIDLRSRIAFPVSFLLFQVFYWTWYTSL